MESDIKLEGNHLHLEADFIHARSCDLILDCPDRNKGAGGPLRRALVHDFNDGLTINWAGDYPGGVTINGVVNTPGKLNVNSANFTGNITIEKKEVKPGTGGFTTVTDARGFPRMTPVPAQYIRTPIDLGLVIGELLSRVASLEAKVATLEGKK